MKERPILFSAAMVKAILAGQKTMTRRIIADGPAWHPDGRWTYTVSSTDRKAEDCFCYAYPDPDGTTFADRGPEHTVCRKRCPYGLPGDRLVVKEAAWVWCRKEQDGLAKMGRPKFNYIPMGRFVHYQADGPKPTYRVNDSPDQGWRLQIGRYLPRWASRLALEVSGVRVERLQDISEEDARAEGCSGHDPEPASEGGTLYVFKGQSSAPSPLAHFRHLWAQIHGPESWESNPYVWCIAFKRLEPTP